MRIIGTIVTPSPRLSNTGTYSFKIATNGVVTKNSTYGNITTVIDTTSMTNIFDGNNDDGHQVFSAAGLTGSNISFLGTTYDLLYISGNGGFSFGQPNDNRGQGDTPSTPFGSPCIYMNNNDACLNQVWYCVFGGSTLAFKVRGNTSFSNSPFNYEYDIYFNADGTVDVFVVQEPTNFAAYNDNPPDIIWGVTDGTNWVDGLPNHTSSFGASTISSGKTGLRITGGLRIGSPPPPPSLFTPLGTPTSLNNGLAYFEMGEWNPSDPANVVDISGQNHSFGFNDQTYSGNVNYAHFFNNSAQANNWDWPADNITAMTICGWFAFASLTGDVSLISRNEGSSGWALRVDSSGTVINLVKYSDADQVTALSTPLSTNTWHFIGVSQNGTTVDYVIDGTQYTISASGNPFVSSGGPVRLQYDPYNGGNQNTEMWMRDVKVFSANLGPTGLQNIYNAQKSNYGY